MRQYSAQEQKVLEQIPKNGKPIDTKTMILGVYAPERPPDSAQQSVMVTINKLILKVNRNKEDFVIKKGRARGPYPLEVWRERRKYRRDGKL
jgi:hypothetical protein